MDHWYLLCTLAGWRWSYRSAAAELVAQLERIFTEVERALRRDALMLPAAEPPPSSPADDDAALLAVLTDVG